MFTGLLFARILGTQRDLAPLDTQRLKTELKDIYLTDECKYVYNAYIDVSSHFVQCTFVLAKFAREQPLIAISATSAFSFLKRCRFVVKLATILYHKRKKCEKKKLMKGRKEIRARGEKVLLNGTVVHVFVHLSFP